MEQVITFLIASAAIVGVSVAILPLSAYRGFVISKLWLWFVVPLGVPAISLPHAIGLSFLIFLFTYTPTATTDDRTDTEKTAHWAFHISWPIASLLCGYIVKQWM